MSKMTKPKYTALHIFLNNDLGVEFDQFLKERYPDDPRPRSRVIRQALREFMERERAKV